MNHSTYLFSDVQVISDVQKTMSKMFTGMTPRQFVKSSKVWSKLKLFLWASTCLFFNRFYPVCCHSHEWCLIWICPCISCEWNFANWFLYGFQMSILYQIWNCSYLHLFLKLLHMFFICFFNMVAHGGATRNIWLFQLFMKKHKYLS